MQSEFERLVSREYFGYLKDLKLDPPAFEREGFVSWASMTGSGGVVELACGPAEYHAEIFISTRSDNKRWHLADLMGLESVRRWMSQNRPQLLDKTTIEAEVGYFFELLSHGLSGEARFSWVSRTS